MSPKIEFKMFLALWNRRQGLSTPALHFRMADWLEENWRAGNTRLLLQAFRSSGKSTITGLFAAWLLYRNPDIRILVLAADLNLARKMVRNVKRIIERHPLTTGLKPARLDQWGADRFTVNRTLELRDPSMLAKGVSANITGSRADVVICDDVEVPNTCDTALKREDLRERLAELDYILVPGGSMLYIGTPHTWYTIYAQEPRTEIGEEFIFLEGFERLTLPVLDENKVSAWPERFTPEDLLRMRQSTGPNKFASQMMLTPVNITEGRLDPAQLQFYDSKLHRSVELDGLYLEGHKMVACSAWWDPAFGHKGDGSALAILYTDEDGRYYLHRLEYITVDTFDETDEATQQCKRVAFLAQLLHVPVVNVETNGIGNFLPKMLRRELARKRVPCSVNPVHSSRAKHLRILESFDVVLAARGLFVHESVKQTPFLTEMQEWQPNRKSQRDDGLDAVAGALSLAPIRLQYERFSGRQTWHGGKGHTAKTDFEV